MPQEIVEDIRKACKAGTMSQRMKNWKKRIEKEKGHSISCEEFAHIAASVIENKQKSEARGGEVPHKAYAFYAQSARGGTSPGSKEKTPFWLSVMDGETKLRDDQYGPVGVDDLALLTTKEMWKDVDGHVDHYTDLVEKLNISDAKFDFNGGELFLKMLPERDNIYDGLRSGRIKPSIEIRYFSKDIDEGEDYVTSFEPAGLGLMVDGAARGPNVGPKDPSGSAIGGKKPEGGSNMTKEEKDPEDSQQGEDQQEEDPKKKKKEDPEGDNQEEPEEEEEEEEEEPKKDDIAELKEKFENQNKQIKEILDNNKKLAGKKRELEEIIINNIVEANKDKYPKSVILNKEDMSVEDVEARVKELENLRELINEGYPDEDIPPIVQKPQKEEKFDEDGRVTDEYFDALMKMVEPKKKDKKFEALF